MMQFAWLFQFLVAFGVPIVKKILVGLGIGAITYTGINAVLDAAKAELMANMSGLPSEIAALLGIAKFDIAINIVLSAVATRLLISGVSKVAGSKTKLGSTGG
jgi:maltodextrin utilization protein YvdJ